MSVITAKTAGFCWGVRRAVDKVVTEIKKGEAPFQVYGPLVHNPQVIEALKDRGVATCAEPWDQRSGTLFLRTHGVTVEERKRLKTLPVQLRDLTCPRVGRALAIAAKQASLGADVLIFGDPGHHEVKAILSAAGPSGRVITSVEDADSLPELRNPFLLSQTTQNTHEFEELLGVLKKRWPNIRYSNTICDSTSRRQAELRELMTRADAVVIVGGLKSANTGRLAQIAGETGLPVFRVETHEELNPEALSGYKRILLSAGASTPEWSIRKVRERLLEIQGRSSRAGRIRSMFRNLVFSGVHIPLTALCIALAQGVTLGGEGWGKAGLLAGFLLWSFTNFTAVLECRKINTTSQKRQEFVQNHSVLMLAPSILGPFVSILLAVQLGATWIIWTVLSIAFCLLYALPRAGTSKVSGFLRKIPGSREITFTLAWSTLVCVLPAVTLAGMELSLRLLVWPFSLAFLFFARSLLIDLVDLQGDALLGMDTLPLHLGSMRCRRILMISMVAAPVIQTLAVVFNALPLCALGFVMAPALLAAAYLITEKKPFPSELSVRVYADGSLFLAGLVPFLLCMNQ
ncbi:4-hydroxy-3-methylbut-2-enyl diphosphate reductase [Candidatus Fermentibacteria bacterium]|nr:MAG: 4-hydroxy-3-methylbut-2-enyl diphosphate reductase [Candidatus Fermentibacteria bacterium]